MKVSEKTVDIEKLAGVDIKDQTSEKKTTTKSVKSEKAAAKEESVKEESSETKTAAKKTTAKPVAKTTKAAAAKKTTKTTTAKKTTAKPAKVECELYIQYNGNQLDQAVLLERVEEDCINQGVSVKELKLYLKPEDNACYYVANGSFAGKVDLF